MASLSGVTKRKRQIRNQSQNTRREKAAANALKKSSTHKLIKELVKETRRT